MPLHEATTENYSKALGLLERYKQKIAEMPKPLTPELKQELLFELSAFCLQYQISSKMIDWSVRFPGYASWNIGCDPMWNNIISSGLTNNPTNPKTGKSTEHSARMLCAAEVTRILNTMGIGTIGLREAPKDAQDIFYKEVKTAIKHSSDMDCSNQAIIIAKAIDTNDANYIAVTRLMQKHSLVETEVQIAKDPSTNIYFININFDGITATSELKDKARYIAFLKEVAELPSQNVISGDAYLKLDEKHVLASCDSFGIYGSPVVSIMMGKSPSEPSHRTTLPVKELLEDRGLQGRVDPQSVTGASKALAEALTQSKHSRKKVVTDATLEVFAAQIKALELDVAKEDLHKKNFIKHLRSLYINAMERLGVETESTPDHDARRFLNSTVTFLDELDVAKYYYLEILKKIDAVEDDEDAAKLYLRSHRKSDEIKVEDQDVIYAAMEAIVQGKQESRENAIKELLRTQIAAITKYEKSCIQEDTADADRRRITQIIITAVSTVIGAILGMIAGFIIGTLATGGSLSLPLALVGMKHGAITGAAIGAIVGAIIFGPVSYATSKNLLFSQSKLARKKDLIENEATKVVGQENDEERMKFNLAPKPPSNPSTPRESESSSNRLRPRSQ